MCDGAIRWLFSFMSLSLSAFDTCVIDAIQCNIVFLFLFIWWFITLRYGYVRWLW